MIMKIKFELDKNETNACIDIYNSFIQDEGRRLKSCNIKVVNKAIVIDTIIMEDEGIIYDIDVKPGFVKWILNRVKPVIVSVVNIIKLLKDLFEDTILASGSTKVIVDGQTVYTNQDEAHSNDLDADLCLL